MRITYKVLANSLLRQLCLDTVPNTPSSGGATWRYAAITSHAPPPIAKVQAKLYELMSASVALSGSNLMHWKSSVQVHLFSVCRFGILCEPASWHDRSMAAGRWSAPTSEYPINISTPKVNAPRKQRAMSESTDGLDAHWLSHGRKGEGLAF